jgi:hypothetical protein
VVRPGALSAWLEPLRDFSQLGSRCPDLVGAKRWEHIDLLAVRHSNQGELAKALSIHSSSGESKNDFVGAQVNLALGLVAWTSPRIVIAVNRLAASMLRARIGDRLRDCGQRGYHQTQNLGSTTVSWFFSGMLTGQHALDRYSYDRLKWHVRWSTRRSS